MKTFLWITIGLTTTLALVSVSASDREHKEDKHGREYSSLADIRAVNNPKYLAECGSCHFAYQPGLLPAESWKRIMQTLDQHFGENAELNAEDTHMLTSYLVDHAASSSGYGRSGAFAHYQGDAPLRITETPYFKRKHHEVPLRFLKDSRIGSFSNCSACHQQAAKGNYDEDGVRIPGAEGWHD